MVTFDEWYQEQYGSVLAAVVAFCVGNHAAAEDATNEAFVVALEDWQKVSQMDAPTAWVAKVAINTAGRTFKRRRRGIELLNSQRLEMFTNDIHRDIDLWNSLAELSPRQRQALVLRYIEDLSQADVALRMKVATGTAAATLTQARGSLRSSLTEGKGNDDF